MSNPCEHEWHKTGHSYPSGTPVYFFHCPKCDAVGRAKDGQPVYEFSQIDHDALDEDPPICLPCRRGA